MRRGDARCVQTCIRENPKERGGLDDLDGRFILKLCLVINVCCTFQISCPFSGA
jgi:hypothetical protein